MNQSLSRRASPANDHVSLDDAYAHPTWNPLRAFVDIPQSGAEFYTISGEAKTIAQVWLAPGDGLSRYHRKLAQAHPFVSCHVLGDRTPAPAPADFHGVTLLWALSSADRIAIWSAPFPQFADDVPRWGIAAADAGAHFLTTITTTEARASDWSVRVQRWKRPGATVTWFGPTGDRT